MKTEVKFFKNSGQIFQKLRFPATAVAQIAGKVCKKQACHKWKKINFSAKLKILDRS